MSETGGIALPWIGAAYREGGLVVIGLNLNNASGLAIEYGLMHNPERGVLSRLSQGKRRIWGTPFHYRLALTASALLAWQRGEPIATEVSGEDLAATYHRLTKLQAVKCSPARPRSRPPTKMKQTCTDFLLADDLNDLRPSLILALGTPALYAVKTVTEEPSLDELGNGAFIGEIDANTPERPWQATLVSTHHPVASSWTASYQTLLATLEQRKRPPLQPHPCSANQPAAKPGTVTNASG